MNREAPLTLPIQDNARGGNAFHIRFRHQNGTHAAMNSAGDAGRGVGGGLSGE